MKAHDLSDATLDLLHKGTVLPAHPLVLNTARQLDEAR